MFLNPIQTIHYDGIRRQKHALILVVTMLAIAVTDVCFAQSPRPTAIRQKTSFSMVAFQDEATPVPNQANPQQSTSRETGEEDRSKDAEYLPEPIANLKPHQTRDRKGQTSVLEEPLVINAEPEPWLESTKNSPATNS